MKQDYIDRTIIRLKRQYSKDELVAALIKKLSESETKNGILLDEIDYLKSIKVELAKDEHRQILIEARKDKVYKDIRIINATLIKKNKELTKDNERLIYKLHSNT
jgi:hypothetical protein